MKVLLHEPLQSFIQPEQVLFEKLVPLPFADLFDTVRDDHVVHPRVGVHRNAGVIADELKVLGKRTFPRQMFFLPPVFSQSLQQIHGAPSQGKPVHSFYIVLVE